MNNTEFSISRTKVIVPTLRPEILHRARLLALFDNLLDKKLILVTAPAGYGKTSLLVDFAHQSQIPVCWLSLDGLDQDPTRFSAYLIAALTERFPNFGNQSRSVLRGLVNLEQDSERLLSTLVNEIDSQIDKHFALVVDDYQFIDSIADVRNLFSRFVYLAGENCHIILASRRLPNLPDFTSMVAKQQVGGFDLEQLAFRAEEIRSLFEKNFRLNLSEEAVEELMLQTEGWITGLILSGYDPAQTIPDLTRAARTAGVDLGGYFEQQVLTPQPPELREFLLQTSLLEEFDAGLCEAVFGAGDWKKLIKTVRHGNLFALPVGPGGKWLRYHPLFQEFLQERMREDEPEKVEAILLRLAEAYKTRQEWERAHRIYRQLRDADQLADLVEVAGKAMLLSEQLFTLRTWLEQLPPSLIEARPALLSLMATVLCTMGEGQSALAIFDRVIPLFQKNNDYPGLAFAFVGRAAANRMAGDYSNSLQDAEEAMRISEGKTELQFTFAEAKRFKGTSLYHLGRIAEATREQEETLQLYELWGDKRRATFARMGLGMTYRAGGNYPAAREANEKALTEFRQENNLPSQADVLNSLGVMHHSLGEYEKAGRAFESGLELARKSHSSWQESLLLASLGDMYTDLDENESAMEAYSHAAEVAQTVNFQFLTNYLSLAQARLARLSHKTDKARFYLKEVEKPVRQSGSNYESGLFHLERGCLRLMEDELEMATNDLKQALDYFQFGRYLAETAWSQIWLAAADLNSDRGAIARTRLEESLNIEQASPLQHSLAQVVRRARPWLKVHQQEDGIGIILAPWLARAEKIEAQLPAHRKHLRRLLTSIPIQTPHLTIHAFGRTQVRVKGELVTPSKWKAMSAKELFFYILAASRPLTKEEIGDTFWPESDTNQLKLSFKNNLYRLRHAIGQDVIIFEDNLYRFNHYADYEYDVENFTTHLRKAKEAVEIIDKIVHLRAATQLRKGPYLQDLDGTWILPERERLEQAWLEAMKQLAESERQIRDLQAAVQTCHEALKVDTCREDIHRLAMQLHYELGERLAIIWQYQACCKALRSELDIDPSEETEALYRRLAA
jgi:ATP/maltotriose-dependent transcriptional regulator MalT